MVVLEGEQYHIWFRTVEMSQMGKNKSITQKTWNSPGTENVWRREQKLPGTNANRRKYMSIGIYGEFF